MKQVTIYAVEVDHFTRTPTVCSVQAIDKGGLCYWVSNKNRHGAFSWKSKVMKSDAYTRPEDALSHWIGQQEVKEVILRTEAATITTQIDDAKRQLLALLSK